MKIPSITLAFFLGGFSLCSYAQKTKVFNTTFEIADLGKNNKGIGQTFIGNDGKFSYALSSKGVTFNNVPLRSGIVVNKWDYEMNLVSFGEIPMKTDDYKIKTDKLGQFFVAGEHLVHIVEYENKITDQIEVFLVEYNTTDFKPKTITKVGAFDVKKRIKLEIGFVVNPDEPDNFIVWTKYQVNVIETRFDIFVIDKNLQVEQEWSTSFETEFWFLTFDNIVYNSDNISFVSVIQTLSKYGVNDGEIMQCMFHRKARGNDHDVLELPIELKSLDRKVTNLKTNLNEQGNLVVSGFYTRRYMKESDFGGAFIQIYDIRKKELISQDRRDFDIEFVTQSLSDEPKNTASTKDEIRKSFSEYCFLARGVLINEDGSSILVGERYREYESTLQTQDLKGTKYDHNVHADIVVMRTNESGRIEWLIRSSRYAEGINEDISPQLLIHNNHETIEVIYISRDEFSTVDKEIIITQFKKGDGSYQSEVIFSKEETEGYFVSMGTAICLRPNYYTVQLFKFKKPKALTIQFED